MASIKTECPRAGRWIGGCKFKPVLVSPLPFNVENTGNNNNFSVYVPPLTQKFVAMACTRCGRTIERRDGDA